MAFRAKQSRLFLREILLYIPTSTTLRYSVCFAKQRLKFIKTVLFTGQPHRLKRSFLAVCCMSSPSAGLVTSSDVGKFLPP